MVNVFICHSQAFWSWLIMCSLFRKIAYHNSFPVGFFKLTWNIEHWEDNYLLGNAVDTELYITHATSYLFILFHNLFVIYLINMRCNNIFSSVISPVETELSSDYRSFLLSHLARALSVNSGLLEIVRERFWVVVL